MKANAILSCYTGDPQEKISKWDRKQLVAAVLVSLCMGTEGVVDYDYG